MKLDPFDDYTHHYHLLQDEETTPLIGSSSETHRICITAKERFSEQIATIHHVFTEKIEPLNRLLDNHNNRVLGLHDTLPKKVVAFLMTTAKVALVCVPLILVSNPYGMAVATLFVLTPLFLTGIKKGLEKYAEWKFSQEHYPHSSRDERDAMAAQFVQAKLAPLASAGRTLGWMMNPIGNLAGAVILKGIDTLQTKIREQPENYATLTADWALGWLKLFTYHAARMAVPMILDTPLQIIMSEISHEIQPTESPSYDPNLINGQDIRDQHYDEIFWVQDHNVMHSAGNQSGAEPFLLSQMVSNQSQDPMDVASHSTAFEIDLSTDAEGNIIMEHGGIPMGDAQYTHDFFQAMANNLAQDNGRMVQMEIQNDGVPVDQLAAYFDNIHTTNAAGQEVSLSDMFVDKEDYDMSLGDIYDQGDKVFVILNNTTWPTGADTPPAWTDMNEIYNGQNTAQVPWQATYTYEQTFADANLALEQVDSGAYHTASVELVTATSLLPGGEVQQEILNSRADDWLGISLAEHPNLEGGTISLDYSSHTPELDRLVKEWNETPPDQRDELRLELAQRDYSLSESAINLDVAKSLFHHLFIDSMFDPRYAGINPLGNLTDIQLGRQKRRDGYTRLD